MRRRPRIAVALAALALLGVAACGDGESTSTGAGTAPVDTLPGAAHAGQFVAECAFAHSATDDPIVWRDQPGQSHRHDFFGGRNVNASSTAASLRAGGTTCQVQQDFASYWAPSLFDDGVPLEPLGIEAYYRAAAGVDPDDVEPYPDGIEILGGDPRAEPPQDLAVVGWACGTNPLRHVEPPACGARSPLVLRVTFPDCWDGEHIRTEDHRSHTAYSGPDGCPSSHPVALPQLELVIRYPFSGDPSRLALASGEVTSGHADFLNAWDPAKLAREVRFCIDADVVCGVATN